MTDFTTISRIPRVRTTDMNDGTVEVVLFVQGLEPTKDKFKPKHGKVSFDWFNDDYGFTVEIEIKDNKAKTITKWSRQAERMPTKINRRDSKWTVEKGKLIITIVKAVAEPWMKKVRDKGLDQASSSDTDEEAEGNNAEK
ncbi:unnamed protein product [Lymnaea stagnalis]|uniref:CS domain-containing protein n=1 Tax=Lymnaea stagnalis TaxID=6523 RepID=A0AAV2HVX3_LYMST